jgi:hypothetical protein
MRKVFYGCAALAVLGVAGVYVVTDQAARHPNSLAGRCLAAAAQVGVHLDPFAVLGRSVPHVPAAPVGCEKAPCPQGEVAGGLARVSKPPKLDAEDGLDPDAGEAAEEPAEPMEVIEVRPAPEARAAFPVGGAEDEGPEACEEGGDTAVSEETREPLAVGEQPAEESEPTADSGHYPDRMPYADEEQETPPADGCLSGNWVWEIIKHLALSGAERLNEPSTPAPADEPAAPLQPAAESCPECQHHCPSAECPYPHSATPPALDSPAEESSQPEGPPAHVKKHHKTSHQGAPTPEHKPAGGDSQASFGINKGPTGLDTLEYRPSDGNAHAFDHLLF